MSNKEKAFYMGKRLTARNTLKHTFCDDNGSWHYPKAKDFVFLGCVIGHEYDLSGDTLPKLWEDVATGVISDDAAEWEVNARIDRLKKREAGKEPSPQLKHHVGKINELLTRATPTERTVFLTYLITTFMGWKR